MTESVKTESSMNEVPATRHRSRAKEFGTCETLHIVRVTFPLDCRVASPGRRHIGRQRTPIPLREGDSHGYNGNQHRPAAPPGLLETSGDGSSPTDAQTAEELQAGAF